MEKKNFEQVSIWKQENKVEETILFDAKAQNAKVEKVSDKKETEDVFDEYENMSEEELDELFRRKRTNSLKDMAPYFISRILEEETSVGHGMTKVAIEERLKKFPYEITVGRSTVDRVVNGLTDCGFGYFYTRSKGAWYDPDRKWVANY